VTLENPGRTRGPRDRPGADPKPLACRARSLTQAPNVYIPLSVKKKKSETTCRSPIPPIWFRKGKYEEARPP